MEELLTTVQDDDKASLGLFRKRLEMMTERNDS